MNGFEVVELWDETPVVFAAACEHYAPGAFEGKRDYFAGAVSPSGGTVTA